MSASWDFQSANAPRWRPGSYGKGNVYDDGSVQTWRINETGDPHHNQVADGRQPEFLFYIDPDGTIHHGDVGYLNTSNYSDAQMLKKVIEQDRRLRPRDNEIHVPDVRWLGEGGFGHGPNLLDRLSWVEPVQGLEDVEEPRESPEDELAAWLRGFDAPQQQAPNPYDWDQDGAF